jgi:processive 1,2-diacylglycerol beta-glucosyltransferase
VDIACGAEGKAAFLTPWSIHASPDIESAQKRTEGGHRLKLLIVSASTGMGHMAAARGVEKAAQARGHSAVTVDVMDRVTPLYRTWFRGGYERLVRRNPKMWGHLYRTSDLPRFNYRFQTGLDYLFCGVIAKMVQSERPDWVVCTHSIAQPRIPRAGRPMAIVVTDLYPHRMWLRGSPDLFCLPSEWSAEMLRQRVPGAKYVVTGIPISPEFQPGVVAPGRVLLTAGGIGGGPVLEAAQALVSSGVRDLQIVTGWNTQLRAQLEGKHLSGVTVHGFLQQDEMARLLQSAALLVAKPGGLTTMEALSVGTPFLVYQPFLIPGQEEQNAEFLVEAGAGVRARSTEELGREASALLRSPVRLEEMRARALEHGKPDAAENVVRALEG